MPHFKILREDFVFEWDCKNGAHSLIQECGSVPCLIYSTRFWCVVMIMIAPTISNAFKNDYVISQILTTPESAVF